MSYDKTEKKIVYPNSLISLLFMHEVVVEAILRNNFLKTAQLHLENCSWSCFFKKTSFINEAEL